MQTKKNGINKEIGSCIFYILCYTVYARIEKRKIQLLENVSVHKVCDAPRNLAKLPLMMDEEEPFSLRAKSSKGLSAAVSGFFSDLVR